MDHQIDQFSPEKYVTLWLSATQEDLMINGKSLKKEVGIFCNFIKLIKLFMYFIILMIFYLTKHVYLIT